MTTFGRLVSKARPDVAAVDIEEFPAAMRPLVSRSITW